MFAVSVLGELGTAYEVNISTLVDEEKQSYTEGWQKHGFNQYVSDRISLQRTLQEVRDPRYQIGVSAVFLKLKNLSPFLYKSKIFVLSFDLTLSLRQRDLSLPTKLICLCVTLILALLYAILNMSRSYTIIYIYYPNNFRKSEFAWIKQLKADKT